MQESILYLLSFLYPSETLRDAKDSLLSGAPDLRAHGLEVIENLLHRDLLAKILPLFDDVSAEQRLALLQDHLPARARDEGIGGKRRSWPTRNCCPGPGPALPTRPAGAAGRIFKDALVAALSDPAAVVRETALWALSLLEPKDWRSVAARLLDDVSPAVRSLAAQLLGAEDQESAGRGADPAARINPDTPSLRGELA